MKSLSVKQFNQYVKTSIKHDPLFQNVSIEGEIANLKVSHEHIFFSLKEDNDIVDCAIFFYKNEDFENINNGDMVVIIGNLTYSTYSSRLTIAIKDIKVSGLSDEYLRFLKLKEDFYKKGYFDLNRKKKVKDYPKNIGLITSSKSAAIVDFISVINKEMQDIEIFLYPVKVQGSSAKDEIIKALNRLEDMDLDCIVLTRGGGSKEDLKVFNEKDLVEMIYNLNTPIVSAIGHKIDNSLTDLVSDISLQTPTEAGSYLVRNYKRLREDFKDSFIEIKKVFSRNLELKEIEVSYLKQRLDLFSPNSLIEKKKNEIDIYFKSIKDILNDRIGQKESLIENLNIKLSSIKEILDIRRKSISIKSLDGYDIYSKFSLKDYDFVKIVFSDGEVKAQIKYE
ncbi:exodeoxyribonuclease VII large subunit [Anaerococcus sp. WCA-380-WT-2B]|uniref:Exodeoxyribonuclease 7 large subunit n=1 Tax=Anaerococcus porci TaxID=2652269 RepID=A0A6N7VC37_9FIRM|nr:exodeoxyribonuclease VII large subunit [Anaerococcus porci]MSS77010.1 exodeoxyribonuclease VII large subunit [Anaerococcus porci]